MIAVDANVLAYLHLSSEFSQLAAKAYKKDPHSTAPMLWQSERRNILAGYLRRGLLTLEMAEHTMQYAAAMMDREEVVVPATAILRLVVASACSAYDCEYVALTQQFQIHLLTMDKRILAEFPETAERLDVFVSA